jgi:hypothetical protein
MTRFQPAFYGGLFIGILSGLPGVQLGNCCCCLWVISGGVIATYLLQKNSATPIETTEAMVQGLLAGLIGAVIAGVMDVALGPIIAPIKQRFAAMLVERLRDMPNLPSESRTQLDEMMRQQGNAPFAQRMVSTLIFVPVAAVMAMLGALLGVAFFRKKAPAPPVQG